MIDYHRLKNWDIPAREHTYTADDTMFYALSLGAGADPVDEQQLKFVTDVLPGLPLALPTMAVILGYPGSWMQNPETGIDFGQIVHGEEQIVLHQPLAAAGTVISHHRVKRIVDKGPGRGATITYDKDIFDKGSGAHLATVTHTTFARGDGGFSAHDGLTDQALPAPPAIPRRDPNFSCDIATVPQQALLYRLCADRNPLHALPAVARAAGFDRPILHGLCTYGLAGRALLALCCAGEPRRLKSLFARFTAPVYPGETIRVDIYNEGERVLFRAIAKESNKTVLDSGCAIIG